MKKAISLLLVLILIACSMPYGIAGAESTGKSQIGPGYAYSQELELVTRGYEAVAEQLREMEPGLDVCSLSSLIFFRGESDLTKIGSQYVANGGGYSAEKTFMFSAGAGIDDESYWQISFTFDWTNPDEDTLAYNMLALVYGAYVVDLIALDEENPLGNAFDMIQDLLDYAEDGGAALSNGKVVFFANAKPSPYGGQMTLYIGADSQNYYDNSPYLVKNYSEF